MKAATLISVLLLAVSTKCLSQAVVTAPKLEVLAVENKGNLLKQLAEAGKQSKTLQESSDLLKKSADLYYKINKSITSLRNLKRLTESQIDLVKQAGKAVSEGRRISTSQPDMLMKYIENINNVIAANTDNVQLLNNIMTEGLRLSDGERIRFVDDLQQRTDKNLIKIRNLRATYKNYTSSVNLIKW